MLPPTDSISRAMSSALRLAVPLMRVLRHQLGDAVVGGGLGQHTALEGGAEFNERQAMIFLHEQAQAVGQFEFLNRAVGVRFAGDGGFGRGAFGEQGVERAIFGREILARDALDIGGRDAFYGGEITLGKSEIIRGEPA